MTHAARYAADLSVAAANREIDACAQGDCRYASSRPNPTATCAGYQGTVYLEGGVRVLRYAICARHRRWWDEERRRRQEKRREEGARMKGEGRG